MLAVLAGHGLLLWALIKGLSALAPQPPEMVVMAQMIAAPVVAEEKQAEPEPPKPQPKVEPKVHKPQPLAVKPKKEQPKQAERVVAPAPEKVASSPVESPKETKTEVASGAPNKGLESTAKVEVKPTLVGASNNLKPDYPPLSRRLGEEGTAIVFLEVQSNGRVGDARIHKSSGYPRLDAEALVAVRRAQFSPGSVNGVPVVMWVKQPIRFNLSAAE